MAKEKANEPQEEEVKQEEVQQPDGADKTEDPKFTQSDLDAKITSRLKRERDAHEKALAEMRKEFDEKLQEGKLSEEEKAKKEIEKREVAIKEKDAEVRKRELALQATDMLNEAGLPLEYRPYILGADEDETKERLDKLKALRQKDIEAAVDGRFKDAGRDPHKRDNKGAKIYTREDVGNMSNAQIRANLSDIEESMKNW